MSDLGVLTVISVLIGLFGQFPVQDQRIRLASLPGAWALLIFLFHALSVQSIYGLVRFFVQQDLLNDRDSQLQDKVILLIMVFYLSLSYGIYFLWFQALPTFLTVGRKLGEYDRKFGVVAQGHFTLTQVSLLASWALSSVMDVRTIKTYLLCVLMEGTGCEQISSWFQQLTQNATATAWIAGSLHMFICSSATVFALFFIAYMSQAVSGRSQLICDNIKAYIENQGEVDFSDSEPVLWIIGTNRKRQKGSRRSNFIQQLNEQVQSLNETFESVAEASKYIVLWFMSLGTILICVTFFTLTSVHWDITELTDPVIISLIATDVVLIVRMMALATTGERLQQSLKGLKTCVLQIPAWSVPEPNDLLDLKHFVSNMEFNLSACGYFIVGRGNLCSILGAVVTYTVILVQFNTIPAPGATSGNATQSQRRHRVH